MDGLSFSFDNWRFNLRKSNTEPLVRLNVENERYSLMEFAKSNNVSLLLKGEKDFITNGNYFKINTTGHPRMAVGGSGDVLAGVCGGLMAKGLTPFESSRLAAYSIGLAGEHCYNNVGPGFLPTDLAVSLSMVLKRS